jgi:hypothetical protein
MKTKQSNRFINKSNNERGREKRNKSKTDKETQEGRKEYRLIYYFGWREGG